MSLLRIAEAGNAHEPLKPGEDLLVTDRYVLFLGTYPGVNVAQRLRFAPESVEETVEEVRALVRARGATRLNWNVANLAKPADLADRLLALGATRTSDHFAVAMALREPPAPAPSGIRVTRVETVDDFRTFVSITHEVFGIEDRLEEELERIGLEGERDVADKRFVRYVAWIDDQPVAAASATFTEGGVILNSASTRVDARGRGAYRALVTARWDDAVRRGTPALVAWAGAMSRPILRRLGFQEIGHVRILVDELASADTPGE